MEGDNGEGRFCRAGIGVPDISIRNMEARTCFIVVLFGGGGGREGGGGWMGAKRPYDTRDHHDTTLVCLVRLHLRMQTNLLSFANEYVCITMPVFSLQIISHSKRDTIN